MLVPLLAVAAVLALPSSAAPDPTASLTLRQLAGQRLIVGYPGGPLPAWLVRWVRRGELAGVIIFSRNAGSRARLRRDIRRLQRLRRPSGLRAPLLVMTDQEGGRVKRLPGAPRRSPAELGRVGSRSLARAEGRATARNLRGVGINVDLAPVMDLGRRGGFQRRTQRSYARRSRIASAIGSAFVRGLQRRRRVAATLKHFPGIGAALGNADLSSQRIGLSRAALRRADERPFAAGVRAGARLVMTSTAVYPAFSRAPAVLSGRLSRRELRGRLGFRGVTITDSLGVRSLHPWGGPGRLAVRAARAGNDLLLFTSGDLAAGAGRWLRAALRNGRISRRSARDSVRRVLELRAALR
ncbi:MAG: glycoside hydrolase family 3 N-terminal domain-containing protein [Thermoleophilaceae bacterium]